MIMRATKLKYIDCVSCAKMSLEKFVHAMPSKIIWKFAHVSALALTMVTEMSALQQLHGSQSHPFKKRTFFKWTGVNMLVETWDSRCHTTHQNYLYLFFRQQTEWKGNKEEGLSWCFVIHWIEMRCSMFKIRFYYQFQARSPSPYS